MARVLRDGTRVVVLAAGLSVAVLGVPDSSEAKKKAKDAKARPNIVVVMTDDQTVESLRVMTQLDAKVANTGVSFRNSFASFPLCCPSRATFLTGQYPDNHGVRTNQLPAGGYSRLDHSNTLPVWLQRAGYHTAHIGKYLNGYGSVSPDTEVPPGWSEWYGSLDNPDAYAGGTYTMYGYTLNENGSIVHYGSTPAVVDPATYQTDVYSAKAQDFIRRRSKKKRAFFLSIAPLAPHSEGGPSAQPGNNPRAAPRHEGAFGTEIAPRPPSFNEADVSDKPADIRNLDPLTPLQMAAVDARYRSRNESLLAVDDMVADLVGVLKKKGELDETVIIFTADNGFFGGEHRVPNGKVRHYEESSRVPLIIRGPGVPKNKLRTQLAANVDLAPTIVDLANAKARRNMDGLSLMRLIEDKRFAPGRGILIEAFSNGDPGEIDTRYSAVRTDRYVYAEHDFGEEELYDLVADPFELTSRHFDPSLDPIEAELDALLARLTSCAGAGCLSRPALKLRVSCGGSGVTARVAGPDAGKVESARFYGPRGKALGDSVQPFERRIGQSRLRGGGKRRIRTTATVLDGREVTLERRVGPGC